MFRAFKNLFYVCFVSVGICFAGFGAASAQDMREILDCRSIDDDTARLACFDRTTTLAAEAVASGVLEENDDALRSVAQASNAFDDSFGAEELNQRRKQAEKKDSEKMLRAKLVGLRLSNSGKYIITLNNGQVWRQIPGDSGKLSLPDISSDGVPIIIKEAILGSHRLRTEASKRTIRVERIE